MSAHIISILGLAGKNFTKSTYSKDLDLPLKSGNFYNSTHCLIDSFDKSATYTFIGTQESIALHKSLFENLPHFKDIFDKYTPIEIASDGIEDIFHHILESITSTQSQNIILDITHGFRHQPIIASSASTLAQINTNKSITIIFAKEIEKGKTYQYISLDKYLQINLIAISLQTFAKTLTVPQISGIDTNKYPFIGTLYKFSNALHANAFAEIFGLLKDTKNELQKIKNGIRFKGLDKILEEVEKILDRFVAIQKHPTKYKQYYEISLLMNEMGYYLIAITYIREAIPLYVLDRVEDFTKKGTRYYDQINAVNKYLNGEVLDPYIFEDTDRLDNKLKKQGLQTLKQMIENIGKIRNDLAHINPKQKDLKEITTSLRHTLDDFKTKCLIQDYLKNL